MAFCDGVRGVAIARAGQQRKGPDRAAAGAQPSKQELFSLYKKEV